MERVERGSSTWISLVATPSEKVGLAAATASSGREVTPEGSASYEEAWIRLWSRCFTVNLKKTLCSFTATLGMSQWRGGHKRLELEIRAKKKKKKKETGSIQVRGCVRDQGTRMKKVLRFPESMKQLYHDQAAIVERMGDPTVGCPAGL